MNFLACLNLGKEHFQAKCPSDSFYHMASPAAPSQFFSMIKNCTYVKEASQCLGMKSQNVVTYHAESNVLQTGTQVWGNKRSWASQRPGQASLVRSLSRLLWHVRMWKRVVHLWLNVSPIDSPGCLPRVYEYHSPIMKASLHSFERIPANIKAAYQKQKHCCDVRNHNH